MHDGELSETIPAHAAEDMARLPSGVRAKLARLIDSGPDPAGSWDRLLPIVRADPKQLTDDVRLRRVAAVVSSSRALAQTLAQHPNLLDQERPNESVTLQVRAALVEIAGDDLSGSIDVSEATARFSDVIDRIVAGQLDSARAAIAVAHPIATELPFAVIAMGKWGARELNYSSDIDLVFVHDPDGLDPAGGRAAALALASRLMANLSSPTFDGPALEVDAGLRPEGAMGPLSRSLDGYERYYHEWAEAWELQALLKTRFSAGDSDLGARFLELASRVVWDEGLDPEALRSIRRIKDQTEHNADPNDIKRARGGIRDIEFTTQLLQLVHGRLDPDLRCAGTVDALDALAAHGYVDETDRDRLVEAYRFLRDLEHRIQLWDLRQTHQLPHDTESLARIGQSLQLSGDPATALKQRLAEVRAEVRDIHERLYFRPILDALVGSPSARLGMDQAALRLEVLGFEDVHSARRALEDLTSGITRRSKMMHQILPLMLDWLSLSPDPDMGLGQLRTLLAHTPDHSALVTLLQSNPLAGERLCRLLGTGRLLGALIDRIPEFVPRLADDRRLEDIRNADAATTRLIGLLDSRPDPDSKLGTVRRFVRRRKLRIAARDVLGAVSIPATIGSLADSGDAAVAGSLHIIAGPDTAGFSVVAMGKWGGRELSYESDLDLMYVFADDTDRDRAFRTATGLSRILSEPSKHGEAYLLDAGIRPEGKNGPLARSLESYRRYYNEWSEPWELLALIRARPVAGDRDLCERFTEMIGPIVWQDRISPEVLHGIRNVKARVETERIPPGEDPDYHLKLGRGSISDVEFLTQMLQLQHGGPNPDLRVTGTLEALRRLRQAEHLTAAEHRALEDAYLFCTRVRLRLHLQTGRVSESLPTDQRSLARVATSLGYDRAADLRDHYRRVTRRARQVFEARFY